MLKASKEVYYILLCEIGCNELKKIKGFNFYLIGIKIVKCQVKVLFEWLATLVQLLLCDWELLYVQRDCSHWNDPCFKQKQ